MRGLAWWPVTLILLVAPFATWGWGWLDKQRTLAQHSRVLEETHQQAKKDRDAAYGLGKRDGIAEVRDQQRTELEATRAALEEMERQLEEERTKAVEAEAHVPASKAAPGPSAEVVDLCKRSASCRERRGLK